MLQFGAQPGHPSLRELHNLHNSGQYAPSTQQVGSAVYHTSTQHMMGGSGAVRPPGAEAGTQQQQGGAGAQAPQMPVDVMYQIPTSRIPRQVKGAEL